MGHPATGTAPSTATPQGRPDRRPRLAEVIVLDHHRPPVSRAVYLRRRIAVAVAVTAIVALTTVLLGRIGASAGPAEITSGHAVVAPGETLWDIAVEHAPADTDPRVYLDRLVDLNGLDGSGVDAWEVVLLPSH